MSGCLTHCSSENLKKSKLIISTDIPFWPALREHELSGLVNLLIHQRNLMRYMGRLQRECSSFSMVAYKSLKYDLFWYHKVAKV